MRAVQRFIVAMLVALAAQRSSAAPVLTATTTDLGNGLFAYDIVLDGQDDEYRSFFAQEITFTGELYGFSKGYDEADPMASFVYSPWTGNRVGAPVQSTGSYAFSAGSGPGSQYLSIPLARVVVAGDLSLTGIIGRNGSTYDFAGTFSSGSALATIEATLDAWEQWLRDNPRPLPNDALEDLTDGTTEPPTGVDPPAIDPPAPRVDPTPDTPVEYPTIDPVPIGKPPFWIGDQVELLPELPGLIDRPVNKHWIFGDPTNWPRLDRIDSPPLIFVDDGPQRYSVGATLDNSMFYTTSNGFGPQNRGQFAPTPEPSSWLLALLAAALLSVMAPRRARRPR